MGFVYSDDQGQSPDTVRSPSSAVHRCLVSRVEGSTAWAERNAKLTLIALIALIARPVGLSLVHWASRSVGPLSLPIDLRSGENAL
jgi:hypothetical protein